MWKDSSMLFFLHHFTPVNLIDLWSTAHVRHVSCEYFSFVRNAVKRGKLAAPVVSLKGKVQFETVIIVSLVFMLQATKFVQNRQFDLRNITEEQQVHSASMMCWRCTGSRAFLYFLHSSRQHLENTNLQMKSTINGLFSFSIFSDGSVSV